MWREKEIRHFSFGLLATPKARGNRLSCQHRMNSPNQRIMKRISPNNPVRRQLFPPTGEDEVRNDNFSNTQTEEAMRETEEKSKKWNYDFKNDRPENGSWKWVPESDNRLIGIRQGETEKDVTATDEARNDGGSIESNDLINNSNQNGLHAIDHEKVLAETISGGDNIESRTNTNNNGEDPTSFMTRPNLELK